MTGHLSATEMCHGGGLPYRNVSSRPRAAGLWHFYGSDPCATRVRVIYGSHTARVTRMYRPKRNASECETTSVPPLNSFQCPFLIPGSTCSGPIFTKTKWLTCRNVLGCPLYHSATGNSEKMGLISVASPKLTVTVCLLCWTRSGCGALCVNMRVVKLKRRRSLVCLDLRWVLSSLNYRDAFPEENADCDCSVSADEVPRQFPGVEIRKEVPNWAPHNHNLVVISPHLFGLKTIVICHADLVKAPKSLVKAPNLVFWLVSVQ